MDKIPTPHIEAREGEIAKTILLPGDPLRAKFIAEHFLENVRQFNQTRNMLGFTGTYQGREVSVMGTGMGCPSMGIYSYELIHFYGVKNLIRIGTAGAMSQKVKVKDMIFAMGTCTTSNFPSLMGLPGQFSPLCSFELLQRAVTVAKRLGIDYHVGNILTSDMFYAPQTENKEGMTWADMGVLAVEMEAAALYTNAAAGGANALAILTISDDKERGEVTSARERETTFTNMMKVALELS